MTLKYIWRSFSLGWHFHVHFSYPWHAFASHGLPAIAELLVTFLTVFKARVTITIKRSPTSVAALISIILQLAANHSIPSNNPRGLTNAWQTIAGGKTRVNGLTVGPTDRHASTARHRLGANHFLVSFIAAARKLLAACCNLQLQRF